MKIEKKENGYWLRGDYKTNYDGSISIDLEFIAKILVSFLNRNTDLILIGFESYASEEYQVINDIRKSGIEYQVIDKYYLVLKIKNKAELYASLKLWSECAGGAGYYAFALSTKFDTKQEFRAEILKVISHENSSIKVILEDISDGDVNLFLYAGDEKEIPDWCKMV